MASSSKILPKISIISNLTNKPKNNALGSFTLKHSTETPQSFYTPRYTQNDTSCNFMDSELTAENTSFSTANSNLTRTVIDALTKPENKLKALHEKAKDNYKLKMLSLLKVPDDDVKYNSENLNNISIKEIKTDLMDKITEEKGVSKKEAKKIVKNEILNSLEAKDWKKLTSNIEIIDSQGETHKYNNVFIPANQMNVSSSDQDRSIFATEYKNGEGVTCYSNNRETDHAANLWKTELFDNSGKEIFNGIRHSSLASPDLNKEMRASSAEHKVGEVIQAALFAKYEQQITASIKDNVKITNPLDLKISSTSLLTLFDLHVGKINETEKTQFNDQMNAFKNAEENLKSINIAGVDIPVNFQFIQFSTGINNLALSASPLMKAINTFGWKKADQINVEGLTKLMGEHKIGAEIGGWAGDYLNRTDVDAQQKSKVTCLVNEVRDIFTHKKHHTENVDRFALPKRLVLLSYLVDSVPAFNCKSGKDRTGMIDAEVKALAAKLSREHDVSAISTRLEKAELLPFYLDSGNFEIQERNLGLSGNKVMNSNSPYLKKLLSTEQYQLMKGNCNDG